MREIEINATETGWEVLIDGVPSPRFDRYYRTVKRLVSILRESTRIFILWPLRVLAFGLFIHLMTGFLKVHVSAVDHHQRLLVQVDLGPINDPAPAVQGPRAAGAPSRSDEQSGSAEARDIRRYLMLVYLCGMWIGTERWLEGRRPDRSRNA